MKNKLPFISDNFSQQFNNNINKFIFVLLILVFSNLNLSAQKLEITKSDTSVFGNSSQAEISINANFRNLTNEDLNVKCSMSVIELIGSDERDAFGVFLGHSATFCWGDVNDPVKPGFCYAPQRAFFESDFSIKIPANSESKDAWFKGYIYPNGYNGISKVSYTFFVEENPNESVTFQVTCEVLGLSVEKSISTINVFPNPTNNNLNVRVEDGKLPTSIQVFSYDGRIILEKNINNSEDLNLDLSNFSNGKYFYNFVGGELNKNSIPFNVQK